MEHRLITGDGALWLPFARSRIKALRASGAPYASQQFTMPDAALVRVRIEPGIEYIHIDASGGSVYMDTGDLKVEFPGEFNPRRLDPAKLNFMDISVGSDYLGDIYLSDTKFGAQTDYQKANRPMVQLMDSLAIGWRHPAGWDSMTAPEQAAWTATKKAEMTEKTVMKKIIMGRFPASLWTGKMRLFMQAQYGMQLGSGLFRFFADMVGTEIVLKYSQPNTDLQWQPGIWGHKSPGVYTADDGKYFILDVTGGTGGFTVYSYEIKHFGGGAKALKKRIAATGDAELRSKLEAYLFSTSYIDLTTKKLVGSYDPARSGGPISYGWKFNTKGDKASIVLVGVAGNLGAHDLHYESTTVHLTFAYTPDTDTAPYSFTLTGTKTAHSDWVDGWGTYNIFVPSAENEPAPSVLFSLATTFDTRSISSFSNVAIYGCYLNDVWTPVTISKSADFSGDQFSNSWTNIYFNPGFNTNSGSAYQGGYTYADEGFSYSDEHLYASSAMSISIGAFTYAGKMRTGIRSTISVAAGGANTKTGLYMNFMAGQIGGTAPACNRPPISSGNPVPPDQYPGSGLFVGSYQGQYTRDTWAYTFSDYTQWTFVVPAMDAEAMYLPTIDRTTATAVTHNHTVSGLTVMREYAISIGGAEFVTRPNMPCNDPGWFGDIGTGGSSYSDTEPPPKPPVITVNTFNRAHPQGVGAPEPGFSYEPVFTVDRSFPYISKGFRMASSYNKRYVGSDESPQASTPGIGGYFIGWA